MPLSSGIRAAVSSRADQSSGKGQLYHLKINGVEVVSYGAQKQEGAKFDPPIKKDSEIKVSGMLRYLNEQSEYKYIEFPKNPDSSVATMLEGSKLTVTINATFEILKRMVAAGNVLLTVEKDGKLTIVPSIMYNPTEMTCEITVTGSVKDFPDEPKKRAIFEVSAKYFGSDPAEKGRCEGIYYVSAKIGDMPDYGAIPVDKLAEGSNTVELKIERPGNTLPPIEGGDPVPLPFYTSITVSVEYTYSYSVGFVDGIGFQKPGGGLGD